MTGPTRAQWKVLSRMACVAVSALGLGWVLHRLDLQALGHVLGQARPVWIAAACAVFGIAFALASARWHTVLKLSGLQVHSGATLRTVLIGHFFNTVLLGPTGGDLAKSALYARNFGFPISSVLASCVLDRFLGGVGFFLFAGSTPGFAAYHGRFSDRLHRLPLSRIALWTCVGLGVVALAKVLRRRLGWRSPFHRIWEAFLFNARALLRQPKIAARALACAVGCHLCISCVFLFSLEAVTHTGFSLAAVFWIFPVISVITSAPVTFAGAGLREGAALFFLGMYGIPAADAVAASLLVLFVYMLWAVFGAVLLLQMRGPGAEPGSEAKSISVVIPALNEAEALPETVAHVREVREVTEILVIDGGSADQTCAVAEAQGCRVLSSPRGRGAQLRVGAAEARGDVVLLLHADTWLPPEAGRALLNCLRDEEVVGGAFWKVFRRPSVLMAGSRLRCGLRLILFRRVLGDQAMFVRRAALEQLGGVPDLPLMEEFELCRRLRRLGRLALAGATVTTSARRFAKRGVVRTYWRMWQVTARYYLGTPAKDLEHLYERD